MSTTTPATTNREPQSRFSPLAKLIKSLDADLLSAASVFAVRLSAAVIAFVMQIVLAKALGVSEYGIYVYLWSWLVIIAHLGALGFSDSVIRFVPRYVQRDRLSDAKGYIITGLLSTGIGGTLIACAGALIFWQWPELWSEAYRAPVAILFFGIPLAVLELLLLGTCRALGFFMLATVPGYIIRPILIVLGVWFADYIGLDNTTAAILGLAIVATGATIAMQAALIYVKSRDIFHAKLDLSKRNLWMKATFPLIIVCGLDEIFYWSDIVILGLLGQSSELGVYFAAVRCMALPAFVLYAFIAVSARRFTLNIAARDYEALQKTITQTSDMAFWFTVFAVGLTMIMSYPMLSLFGPEFLDGIPAMAILGAGLIGRAAIGNGHELLVMLGRQKSAVYLAALALIVNIVLAVVMIPYLGIVGAALSTIIAQGARCLGIAYVARKHANLNVLVQNVPSLEALKPMMAKLGLKTS